MIVSASHKFFFVAAPKSGSTSITEALRPYLDLPKKLCRARTTKPSVRLHHEKSLHSGASWPGNKDILDAHPNWTVLGTCRNPWHRMTAYYYSVALGPEGKLPRLPVPDPVEAFKACVLRLRDHPEGARRLYGMAALTPQRYWLDGCNQLLRFETLQSDFDSFCRMHEIPTNTLPWIMKANYRGDKPWQECYDKETAQAVQNIWGADAEHYGYEAPI